MARLPTVQTNALPTVRQNLSVNPGMFGGKLGNHIGELSGVVDAFAKAQQKEQEKKDAAEVFDAENSIKLASQDVWAEVSEDYKGLDAEGMPVKIEEELGRKGDEIIAGIRSPEAQRIVKQSLLREITNKRGSAIERARTEIDSALDTNYKAGMQIDIDLAVSGQHEAAVAESLMQMRKKIDFMAAHKGLVDDDNAWANQQFAAAQEKIHTGIMDANREERPEVAMAHLNKYKDSINPETYARYHADIDKRLTQKTAMAFATQAAKENMPMDEAVGMLEKNIKDPEKLDLAKSKLFGAYADSKRIKSEQVATMTTDMNKQAYKDGLGSITDRQLDDLAAVDADSAMRYRESRDKFNRIKAAGGDYAPVSDRKIVADVARGIADGDIRDVSDLVTYRPYLDKGDWNNFISKMDDQTKVTDGKLKQAYTMMLPEKERNSGKWDVDQWANYYAFEKEAREGVKENASPEHVHKTAAAWFLKGKIKDSGTFWDDRKTQGEAIVSGDAADFEPTEDFPVNPLTLPGIQAEQKTAARNKPQIVKTGTDKSGRRVVQYSDGRVEYAD